MEGLNKNNSGCNSEVPSVEQAQGTFIQLGLQTVITREVLFESACHSKSNLEMDALLFPFTVLLLFPFNDCLLKVR